MGRVDPAKRVEKLAGLNLQAVGQAGRLEKRFFQLDLRLVVVVELENDVREPFEVRIDRAVERDFGVAPVEPSLLRIVVAHFEPVEMPLARRGHGEETIERDVHVVLVTSAADDREGLGQR